MTSVAVIIDFILDGKNENIVHRSVADIQYLCQGILDTCNPTDSLSECCTSILVGHESGVELQTISLLFQLILESPNVVQSKAFSSLLLEKAELHEEESASDGFITHSAIDMILQSVEKKMIFISRQSTHVETYFVPKGSTLLWKFCICGGYDIELGVVWKSPPSEIVDVDSFSIDDCTSSVLLSKPHLVSTPKASTLLFDKQHGCIEGSHASIASGYCQLTFNNSYSIFNGKYLELATAVVNDAIVEASLLAAEDDRALRSRKISKLYKRILDSKSIECSISFAVSDGPNKLETPSCGNEVKDAVMNVSDIPNTKGNATRVLSDVGCKSAGVTCDPIDGDAVLASSTHETPEPPMPSDKPKWLEHLLSMLADNPILSKFSSQPQSSLEVSDKIHEENSEARRSVHKSESGWNIFGDDAQAELEIDSDKDEGIATKEIKGVRDFVVLLNHLQEMENTIGILTAERDNARYRAQRYESLVDHLRNEIVVLERKLDEKERELGMLKGSI